MNRKRITRSERKALLRCLGKLTLAIVALVDGATPEEVVHAGEILTELVTTWHRALRSIEPVDES